MKLEFKRYTITLENGLTYIVIASSELSARVQMRGMTNETAQIIAVIETNI